VNWLVELAEASLAAYRECCGKPEATLKKSLDVNGAGVSASMLLGARKHTERQKL